MNEPALDLGIVLAVASSLRDVPVDDKVIAFGEVGLSGEVRSVSMAAQRVQEAAKLGFETVILPASCKKQTERIPGVRILGVRTVREAVQAVMGKA